MQRTTTVSAVLVVAFTAACADDPVSQNAPAAVAVASGASLDRDGGLAGPNDRGPKRYVAILDDCDPDDPSWAATGGCTRKNGAVTNAEFGAFLASPLSSAVVGHPAWRNEPSYIRVSDGESVRVTNEGGRTHTFTEVANFGGGRVPQLRAGLTPAPECVAAGTAGDLLPGATMELDGLSVGTHKYQCCIHSWMRAAVKVLPNEKGNQT
jgi:plastocyanin